MAWRVPGYEPLSPLGQGSTGAVMTARDATTGSVVAIRYLSKEVYETPDFVSRFRDEVAMLDRIEHPNVAQVYEFVEGPGTAAVVTELVEGVSLRTLLDRSGALDPESALYIMKGTLLGLGEAHGRGVVHRDVNPENVIIDPDGVIKLVGIGIAAPVARTTATGTARYLSPEQWAGGPATPASDVYAATVMLVECLTGQPPKAPNGKYLGRAGRSAADVVAAIRPEGLPEQVRALLLRGLDPAPTSRPANADAMLDELELAGFRAYGADWESTAQTLTAQVARLLPPPGAPPRTERTSERSSPVLRLVSTVGAIRLGIAVIVLLLVGGGTAVILTGGFATAGPAAPAFSHVPVTAPGPVVPALSSTGSRVDTEKPTQPTGLIVTSRALTAVSLDWTASTDNVGIAGYIIFRNGHQVGTSFIPGYTDSGLAATSTYQYTVTAFDAAGNRSPVSPAVAATTLTEPDTVAPTPPGDLKATNVRKTSVTLTWTFSRDNVGVTGYDVVRDGTVVASVVDTAYTDAGLAPGSTHSYVVRAYDASNNASNNSNQVTVTTVAVVVPPPPTTPTQPTPTTPVTTDPGGPPPTTDPPPPPPPATITSLSLEVSPIESPNCTTSVDVVVTADGPVSTTLEYTVNGVDGTQPVTFDAAGSQGVVLATNVDGTVDGSAHVDDPASGQSADTSWSAPADCVTPPPPPPPPPPDPSNPDDPGASQS